MHSSLPLANKIVSGGLALVLVCWLAGAGFSRDCCAKGPAIHSAGSVPAEASASHCARPDHCRKAESARRAPAIAISSQCAAHSPSAQAMPCCSPAAQAFDGARKVRLVPERLADASGNVRTWPSPVPSSNGWLHSQPLLQSRGETYLRDCAFLI